MSSASDGVDVVDIGDYACSSVEILGNWTRFTVS